MLSRILDADPMNLAFSARDHARIISAHHKLAADALKRDNWTCHLCKTRIPEFMEVDHGDSHVEGCKSLKAICQFCHNLEHPIWAASRGRIIFIHAPEFSQAQLNRLAWAMLSRRESPDFPWDGSRFTKAIEERQKLMEGVIQSGTVEGFLEAVFSLDRRLGREMAKNTLLKIDQAIRFWPSELTAGYADLPAAARISTWTVGGFRAGAKVGARLLRESVPVNPDSMKLAARHASRSKGKQARA